MTGLRSRHLLAAAGALALAIIACSAPGVEPGTVAPTATAMLPLPAPTTAPAITEAATGAATTAQGVGPCAPPMPDPSIPDGASWQVYCSDAYGFSFRYPPSGAALANNAVPGQIYLPITDGTNLGEKYLTVTTVSGVTDCSSPNTEGHEPGTIPTETTSFNGISFKKETGSEAGAGNIYDWVGYSDLSGTLCLSLTFILHSSDPGAYATPPAEFDKAAESAVFDQIMATFTWPTP
jgi:hypothetical protein